MDIQGSFLFLSLHSSERQRRVSPEADSHTPVKAYIADTRVILNRLICS